MFFKLYFKLCFLNTLLTKMEESYSGNCNKKKVNKVTRVFSQAFPPNILGKTDKTPAYSQVHKKFREENFDMNKIIYRPIKASDKEELIELHKEWFPIDYTDDYFDKIIQPRSGKVYITLLATYFFDDQEFILGAVLAELNSKEEFLKQLPSTYYDQIDIPFFETINFFRAPLQFGYIMIIGVIDEMRKKNLGTVLIDKITQEFMKLKNCYCIYLHVVAYNSTAIKFYNKNKFENVTTLKNYYRIKNSVYDCDVFVKFFNWSEKKKFCKGNILYEIFTIIFLQPLNFIIFILTLGFIFKICRKKYKLD
jgi:ribosomal protein S18 acetylase RimI-like enzyme